MRRLIALVVMALVLVEGTGVARALTRAESIECCCGRHDAHRACHCRACPVTKRRARAATARLDSPRECDGHEDAGVLSVLAVPFVFAPCLAPIVSVSWLPSSDERMPGRLVEVGRPPP